MAVVTCMAIGFVAAGVMLVSRSARGRENTLTRLSIMQEVDLACQSVDRLYAQVPLLSDLELSNRVAGAEWTRPILVLGENPNELPVARDGEATLGWEHLQLRLETIGNLRDEMLKAVPGSPHRQETRNQLQGEILRLGEQLQLFKKALADQLAESLENSENTNQHLTLVVGLSSFVAGLLVLLFMLYRRDYARLRETERALEGTEERLLGILSGMQDVVWSASPSGRVVNYVSPAARTLFGIDPAEIVKNPSRLLEHVHREDRVKVRDFLDQVRLSPEGTHEIEYRYTRTDGGRRWIQDRGWAVRGERGELRGLVAVSKDVTDRKDAELALQASEQKYRRIVETTADGIVVVDTGDRIVFANTALEEIFGVQSGDLLERSLTEFVDEEQALLVHPREDTGRFDSNNQFELEIVRADAKVRQVRVTVSPTYNDAGEYTGTLGIYRDSTELIEAQISLIRELAFLSEIEVLGRAILGESDIREVARDACGAAVAYGGVENALIAFRNPRTSALTEYASTFEDAADLDLLRSVLLDETGAGSEVEAFRRDLLHGDLTGPEVPPAFRPLVQRGFHALLALPIRAAGRTYGILYGLDRKKRAYDPEEVSRLRHLTILLGSALSNVTLYARTQAANEELQAAIERLREAERARDQFYRFLIHDLNKPLAAIIGTAGRLQDHEGLPDPLRTRAERIENAALRLRDIVRQLLEYEQVRRREMTLERRPLDVWEQIGEAVSLLEEKRGDRIIDIGGRPIGEAAAASPIFVEADPTAIGRILHNLIDNALDYARTRVSIDARETPQGTVLYVWNDGDPIREEDREGIFREFYRGANPRSTGYGLGLASVKRLIELHGGRVWLEHPPEGGVCFSLLFPKPGQPSAGKPALSHAGG